MRIGNSLIRLFPGTALVLAVHALGMCAGKGQNLATAVSATKEGPKARTEKKADRAKNKDLLARNMKLLNQWGEQPATVQSLYAAAFKALEAKQNATFADVASDSEVQRLCAESGIVHLGGPMLGAVAPDGARVWLRTLRPAKVEVRVTVDGVEKSFGPVRAVDGLSVQVPRAPSRMWRTPASYQ